jgi:hypothetical protein
MPKGKTYFLYPPAHGGIIERWLVFSPCTAHAIHHVGGGPAAAAATKREREREWKNAIIDMGIPKNEIKNDVQIIRTRVRRTQQQKKTTKLIVLT